MEKISSNQTKYIEAQNEREKYVEGIMHSNSKKKIVVAGPGTGKTYLFKKILKGKKNSLTLTFVNSLVEDLTLELYGMTEVRTLHSFSLSILKKILKKDIKISPILSKIIKEDAEILICKEIDFDNIFHNREDQNEYLEFYKKRKDYYNYYGYSDIIYAVIKCFEKDKNKIPVYDQVIIDEFQDFNKLEVSLIDLLSEKSPILLVGDDDQALYEFKSASTHFIRERHSKEMPEYVPFNLPFCARCPRVVVDATNDILNSAKKSGFLKNRIDKPFIYFSNKEKDSVSERYSKIVYTQKFDSQIPWFIEKKIGEMAKDLKCKFTVLIISPYKKQSHRIAETLKKKGLQNIEYVVKEKSELTLLDGIKLIIKDEHDNLGWRIASKFLLNKEDFISLLKNTHENPDKKIHELIDTESKKKVKSIVRVFTYILKNKTVNITDFDDVLKKIKCDPYSVTKDLLKEDINATLMNIGNPAIRKIPIKAITIKSSKGLEGDLVFITHFDNQYFVKNNDKTKITDQDICDFLVSFSRTKRKVYLISTKMEEPTFLKWITRDRIEIVKS